LAMLITLSMVALFWEIISKEWNISYFSALELLYYFKCFLDRHDGYFWEISGQKYLGNKNLADLAPDHFNPWSPCSLWLASPLRHLHYLNFSHVIVRKDTLGTRNSITSTTSEKILLHFFTSKARLHLQFLLRFLVRFSSSDECERVGELWLPPISIWGYWGIYIYSEH
jgi:hypothetical protein